MMGVIGHMFPGVIGNMFMGGYWEHVPGGYWVHVPGGYWVHVSGCYCYWGHVMNPFVGGGWGTGDIRVRLTF